MQNLLVHIGLIPTLHVWNYDWHKEELRDFTSSLNGMYHHQGMRVNTYAAFFGVLDLMIPPSSSIRKVRELAELFGSMRRLHIPDGA